MGISQHNRVKPFHQLIATTEYVVHCLHYYHNYTRFVLHKANWFITQHLMPTIEMEVLRQSMLNVKCIHKHIISDANMNPVCFYTDCFLN